MGVAAKERYAVGALNITDLVHIMLQEVSVDVAARRILWVKVRPDYEPLFAILDGLHKYGDLRYRIEPVVCKNTCARAGYFGGCAGAQRLTFSSNSSFSGYINGVTTSAPTTVTAAAPAILKKSLLDIFLLIISSVLLGLPSSSKRFSG
jgi:hypothetical protein